MLSVPCRLAPDAQAQLVLEASQLRAVAMASFPHRFVALHFAGPSPPAADQAPAQSSGAAPDAAAPQCQPTADTWREVLT